MLLPLVSIGQQQSKAEVAAQRKIIKEALADKSGRQVCCKVISDKETAIAVAEQILFKIYGKDQILSEKPYNVGFVDSYWILSGTLPKGWVGGTFYIVLSSKDGRVIKLIHGK